MTTTTDPNLSPADAILARKLTDSTLSLAYRVALSRNATKPCNADGCPLPRQALDAMCGCHRRRYRSFGHWNAYPVKAAAWAPIRDRVAVVFDANRGMHAGLIEAERHVSSLMARAVTNPGSFKGAAELARLQSHGITAEAILRTAVSASILILYSPTMCPDDRSRRTMVARAVVAMAPQVEKHSWSGNRGRVYRGKAAHSSLVNLGRIFTVDLAEFTATVQLAIEAKARAAAMTDADRRAARTAPMRIA